MNLNSQPPFLIDIPKQLHSDSANALFTTCLSCNTSLLLNDVEYFIEKAIKRYKDYDSTDTIYEYAICMNCHDKILKSYSKESLKNIQTYFSENHDHIISRKELFQKLAEGEFNFAEWTSQCFIKGTPVKDLHEYQIGCQCVGDKMLVNTMPFIIGNVALDEMMMLLSNETLDEMNRFIDDFLGLPGDLKKIFKDSGIFIF